MELDRVIPSNEYYREGNLGTSSYLFFIIHNKLLREVILFTQEFNQIWNTLSLVITDPKSLVKFLKSLEMFM